MSTPNKAERREMAKAIVERFETELGATAAYSTRRSYRETARLRWAPTLTKSKSRTRRIAIS